MTPHELPAMVNAHSHAFQRDLRGAAERPAPEAHAADDFWSWREAMYRLAGDARPGLDARGRRARLRRDGRGRLRRGRRVPLRPPPARRHAVRGPERDGDRRRRGRARGRAARSCCCPPPTTARAGTAATSRPRPASAASATRTSTTYLARVDALRAWADGRDGVHVGVAAHSVRAVPGELAGGDRRLRRRARARPPRARARAAARAGGVPRRARRLPRRAARTAPGFLGPRTSVIHGIHVDAGGRRPAGRERHDRRLVPDDRGQPRRRPLPGARLPRRRRADRDRQRLPGARRPVRGDARARDARPPRARHPPRAARRAHGDLWAELCRERPREPRAGRRRRAGTIAVDRDHPDLRGVADADLPLAVATCASAAVVCRPARS